MQKYLKYSPLLPGVLTFNFLEIVSEKLTDKYRGSWLGDSDSGLYSVRGRFRHFWVFVVFLSPLKKCWDDVSEIGNDYSRIPPSLSLTVILKFNAVGWAASAVIQYAVNVCGYKLLVMLLTAVFVCVHSLA